MQNRNCFKFLEFKTFKLYLSNILVALFSLLACSDEVHMYKLVGIMLSFARKISVCGGISTAAGKHLHVKLFRMT